MRLVTRAADRLLSVIVPRVTASAGCPPNSWTQTCGCYGGNLFQQKCYIDSRCKTICNHCHPTRRC